VEEAGVPTDTTRSHPAVLAFYASLNPFQRQRMESVGVQVRELEPEQAERLGAWRPSRAAGADGRLRLRREETSVVFRLEADASTPWEERVMLGLKGPRLRA
jgi:hypothetical protein